VVQVHGAESRFSAQEGSLARRRRLDKGSKTGSEEAVSTGHVSTAITGPVVAAARGCCEVFAEGRIN
jgi:hypothetical protein